MRSSSLLIVIAGDFRFKLSDACSNCFRISISPFLGVLEFDRIVPNQGTDRGIYCLLRASKFLPIPGIQLSNPRKLEMPNRDSTIRAGSRNRGISTIINRGSRNRLLSVSDNGLDALQGSAGGGSGKTGRAEGLPTFHEQLHDDICDLIGCPENELIMSDGFHRRNITDFFGLSRANSIWMRK